MKIGEELGGSRITMSLTQREVNNDISEDVTLPDYLPEIRKVLYVRESALPPAKFISGGKVDVSGVIDYTLLYVSGDGRLCSAPVSAEYSFSLPLDNMSDYEISEGLTVMAHTFCENTSVRVSAPRRLQLKSRIRTSVGVWGKMLAAEKIVGLENEDTLERQKISAGNLELLCESSDIVTLEDEYLLPSAEAMISSAEAVVSVSEARANGDSLRISGEAIVRLLVNNGGDFERVIRKLPFEAETELDGIVIGEDSACRAKGYITDLSVNVDEGKAKIEANLVLEACVACNREVSYTADIYSTEQKCRCFTRDCAIPKMLCNKNATLSLDERTTLEELGIPEGAELIDVSAAAVVDKAELCEGKYLLRGSIRYCYIFSKDGEYAYAEQRVPFKYECDTPAEKQEVSSFDALAEVISCRARSDSGSVGVDCEILLSMSLFVSDEAIMLEKVEFGEKQEKRRGVFAVCYPTREDTLWSVAKRYAVEPSAVAGDPASDSFVMIEM